MCFILRADKSRYGDILEELRKGLYKGRGKYPNTVPDAYDIFMRKYQQIKYVKRWPGRSGYHTGDRGRAEVFMFAQHGGCGGRGGRRNDTDQVAVTVRNKILHKEIRCYSCQRNGHYLDQCPDQTGMNLAQVGVILTQFCLAIKHIWVLLDTCSTNSASNNTDLVKEIRTCKDHEKLTVSKNGGINGFDTNSTLIFFSMSVHSNQNSIATILSFK